MKALLVFIFVSTLVIAISLTDNESWLTVWLLLFIFVGIPLSLLVTKDLLVNFFPKWLGSSQVLLHICALFGAIIGYGLGVLAVASGHEKAQVAQLMVVIFPALVYLTPLLMLFHGVPFTNIKHYYYKPQNNND